MESIDLCIEWFNQIKDELNRAFPNREVENLEGQRGTEIDAVNDVITLCKDAIFNLKTF